MLHAKAVELSSEKLHSRREKYIAALSLKEEDGAFILALDASANWIESGMPHHNMLESLLKNGTSTESLSRGNGAQQQPSSCTMSNPASSSRFFHVG